MNADPTQAPEDDTQAEAFFEALAGRRAPNSGAAEMRATILADLQLERAAYATASPQAASRDAQTFKQLLEEGVFTARTTSPQPAQPPLIRQWRERLERLLSVRWGSPVLATGVALACLFMIVPVRGPEPIDPGDTLRGTSPSTLDVAEAKTFAHAVFDELRAAGADVHIVQISDQSWVLSVKVLPERADAVRTVIHRRGWRDVTRFPVDLTINER